MSLKPKPMNFVFWMKLPPTCSRTYESLKYENLGSANGKGIAIFTSTTMTEGRSQNAKHNEVRNLNGKVHKFIATT
jgi:hypothetical protein